MVGRLTAQFRAQQEGKRKMIKSILGVILAVACFAPSHCFADANIGVTAFNIDTDVADFRGMNLDVGYDFTDLIGVRASYMIGSEDEVVNGVNIEIDQMYAFDAILSLPLSDSLRPYFTIGKLHIKAKGSYGGYSETISDDFTTYGMGIQFDLREAVSISVEAKDIDGDLMTMASVTANF